MDFTVRELTELDDQAVISLLDQLGEGRTDVLAYHYPFYRKMLTHIGVGTSQYLGAFDSQNRLLGMLPGFVKQASVGSVYSSLPFFGPNGGVITGNSPDRQNIFEELLRALFDQLSNSDIISASIYSSFLENPESYRKTLGDVIELPKFTSVIDLSTYRLDTSNADASALRNVRKAEKSGVTVRTTFTSEDIRTIYKIYEQNCMDYGIPLKPFEAMRFLLEDASASSNRKMFIAEHEGVIIGALLMLYSRSTASYYIPCSRHDYRNLQPNPLLIARAITDALERGLRIWNWESSPSKESGVYAFKKKWGGEDKNYSVFVKLFKEPAFFRALGADAISIHFPYFYVFPFNQLKE